MDRHPASRLTAAVSTVLLAAGAFAIGGCSSDDEPDPTVPNEPEVPFDADVDDGIDTEVEQPGNLGFEDEQPTLDE